MSHTTPSGRRRAGRSAFEPNCSPDIIEELNPYHPIKSWFDEFHSKDWMEGWKEGAEAYEAQMKAEEQTQSMEEEEAEASYERYLINKARYDEEN